MHTEKEQELYNKYPRIFKQRTLSVTESCMGWGITCGDGWFDLIVRICDKIEELYLQLPEEYKTEYFLTADQVKQKLGSLRFYVNTVYDTRPKPPHLGKLYPFLDQIEKESMQTCEECGAPGKRSGRYWIATLCETHQGQ